MDQLLTDTVDVCHVSLLSLFFGKRWMRWRAMATSGPAATAIQLSNATPVRIDFKDDSWIKYYHAWFTIRLPTVRPRRARPGMLAWPRQVRQELVPRRTCVVVGAIGALIKPIGFDHVPQHPARISWRFLPVYRTRQSAFDCRKYALAVTNSHLADVIV